MTDAGPSTAVAAATFAQDDTFVGVLGERGFERGPAPTQWEPRCTSSPVPGAATGKIFL